MPANRITLWTTSLLCCLSEPALAYIGPGAGAGTIAVVLGILASLGMAILALLWYPIKRLIRKRRHQDGTEVHKG